MAGIVDKSMCSRRTIAVRVGNVVYEVPRSGDVRRWVTYNAPEVFWERITRAVEEFERWEQRPVEDDEPDDDEADDDGVMDNDDE